MALEAVSELRRGDEHLDVLTGLQESLLAGVGDAGFGLWLTSQWFAASVERRIGKGEALRRVLEIVDRFLTNPHILLNAAGPAVEARELGLADDLVDRAEEEDPADSGIPRLRANIAWERERPALALELYKEASKKGPPQTWQMGDCYAALGKNSRALRCYRKVLRQDATAADALLHARALLKTPQLLATMPGGWRCHLWIAMHARPFMVRPLLWLWRRLRPEDPFLPIWLARHALIVDDLEVARRWLILTTRKEGTNRLIVTIDTLVVARLLRGRPFSERPNPAGAYGVARGETSRCRCSSGRRASASEAGRGEARDLRR
jgi:tetratricopeptide (TPR) repeat protein